ncbi:MAG: Crp/Fnr family transcriptional regulator [Bacteroidetes bacterium]|jgi:CRP/FNR family transcriptional regulator|nr:Crp/Fnr family transcriptional regulator [Bacteroidota bacterium]
MEKTQIEDLLRSHFPSLHTPAFVKDFVEEARLVHVDEGEPLMEPGGYIRGVPMLIEGLIKVFREEVHGELFLYYIEPGQTCAMSLVCASRDKMSEVKAIAMAPSTCFLVPIHCMDAWMSKHKVWYYHVLETYRLRFEELLKTIDGIAFHQLDERLLSYLERTVQATGDPVVKVSHQDIAIELNTSREVVSRLLKKLEQQGNLKLGRNQIWVKTGKNYG